MRKPMEEASTIWKPVLAWPCATSWPALKRESWQKQSFSRHPNLSTKHTKLAIIHRQHFSLAKDLQFAYRLDYQTTIGSNKVPYFAQPELITSFLIAASNQGLGGKSSGILRNRVVGRWVLAISNSAISSAPWMAETKLYLGTNVFFDSDLCCNLSKWTYRQFPATDRATYFSNYESGKFHLSSRYRPENWLERKWCYLGRLWQSIQ